MPKDDGSSVVVVLVHGTWAAREPWSKEGSYFRHELAERLGARIEFQRLTWSGVNSHRHRTEAAVALRDLLWKSMRNHAGARHFIIAHSHGGNVACYALQNDDLRRAVGGVICLGTPFLHVQRNPLSGTLLKAVLLTLFIFGGLAVHALTQAPEATLTKYIVGGIIAMAIPVTFPLFWALLRRRKSRLGWRDMLKATLDPTGFAREVTFPHLGAERLLVVRISGDEASAALTTSQFFVWLFRTVWSKIAPLWDWFERLRNALAPFVGLILVGAVIAGLAAVISKESVGAVSNAALVFMLVAGFIVLVVGVVAYALLVLIFLMHLPVGLDAMLASLHVQTTVESTPPDVATVFHVAPADAVDSTAGGLRHSALYEHPAVIRFVAGWICARLSRTQEGPPT